MKRHPAGRIIGSAILLGIVGFLIWNTTRPGKVPATPRISSQGELAESIAGQKAEERDAHLVRQLIEEDLGERRFKFATVIEASSGQHVLPFDEGNSLHGELSERLNLELKKIASRLSQQDSPVREERRINEASRHFEDALIEAFAGDADWEAGIPPTRDGRSQRSGYPDIKLVHKPTGSVFYLDPKLVEAGSWDSSSRSFYFEPKKESLKINDDAVHLLIGIGHNGQTGAWQFPEWKIVDLSKLELRLKPEFQASNADLYPQ